MGEEVNFDVMSEDSVKFPEKLDFENQTNLRLIKNEMGKEINFVEDSEKQDTVDVDSESIKFPEFLEIESENLQQGGEDTDNLDFGDSESIKFPEFLEVSGLDEKTVEQEGGNLEDSESIKFPEFIELESEQEQAGGDDCDGQGNDEEGKCHH